MRNIFKIVITVCNAEKYIEGCLNSIKKQTYTNFKCIIINDCSIDNTPRIIQESIVDDKRFFLINNEIRKRALENNLIGINFLCDNDEDIIVMIDGDDELSNSSVLDYLDLAYKNNYIWATYGQFEYTLGGVGSCKYPGGIFKRKEMDKWYLSHLKTFKYFLFKLIQDKDLRDRNGEYFKFVTDIALFYPIAEMAGEHLKFIPEILYKYNNNNPLNDFRINMNSQLEEAYYLKEKESYKILERG